MNSKTSRYQTLVLALAATSSITASYAAAQSPPKAVANTDRVVWAQNFLRAIYPDLNGKNLVATIETYVQYDKPGKPIDYWQLDVGDGGKDVIRRLQGCLSHPILPGDSQGIPAKSRDLRAPEPPQSSDCKPGPVIGKQYVSTGFGFDDDGTLQYYALRNSGGREIEKLNAFTALVRAHPEYTETEIAETLKKIGAKYGPSDKEALIKSLPLAALEPLMGKVRLMEVQFEPLLENRQNVAFWPEWKAKLEVISHSGRKLSYEMTLDRFNGDLIPMNRLDLR